MSLVSLRTNNPAFVSKNLFIQFYVFCVSLLSPKTSFTLEKQHFSFNFLFKQPAFHYNPTMHLSHKKTHNNVMKLMGKSTSGKSVFGLFIPHIAPTAYDKRYEHA